MTHDPCPHFPARPVLGCPSLDRLNDRLQRAFEETPQGQGRGRKIADLLSGYAKEHDEWRRYAMFSQEGYTRNCVFRQEEFELLLLCWGPGQESPIHNHEGQDCWMAVLDGELEEQRFHFPEAGQSGPLEPFESKTFRAGNVAFIRDEMGLHRVRPAGGAARACSLHLYATPYGECNVYCPDTGQVTRRKLVDFSERGRRLTSSS